MCAEFGVHASLPIYSGGLGVLAGDILKEASDLAAARWSASACSTAPATSTSGSTPPACSTSTGSTPTRRCSPAPGDRRADRRAGDGDRARQRRGRRRAGLAGRRRAGAAATCSTPTVPRTPTIGRWITSRLYEGNRAIRLAQYAVLGIGGIRALAALGIEPSRAPPQRGPPGAGVRSSCCAERLRRPGADWDEAWPRCATQLVFTTHTPVPAGNETYDPDEILHVLGRVAEATGDAERFLALGRIDPDDDDEPSGMTVLALRASRVRQRREPAPRRGGPGDVAAAVRRPSGRRGADHPRDQRGPRADAGSAPPMRPLLDGTSAPAGGHGPTTRRRGLRSTTSPTTSCGRRGASPVASSSSTSRQRATQRPAAPGRGHRLRRGRRARLRPRPPDHRASPAGWPPTSGCTCCRCGPSGRCGCSPATRPMQFVFAGKAHPLDDGRQADRARLFELKGAPRWPTGWPSSRTTTCRSPAELVAGCDVWVNVPRPPKEASGTSGMKAALNGALNLSVLDGWWAEAYDGTNGWAIDGDVDPDARRPRTSATPTPSSTSSSTRSCRCSTSATTTGVPRRLAGHGPSAACGPTGHGSPPPGWSGSTPTASIPGPRARGERPPAFLSHPLSSLEVWQDS